MRGSSSATGRGRRLDLERRPPHRVCVIQSLGVRGVADALGRLRLNMMLRPALRGRALGYPNAERVGVDGEHGGGPLVIESMIMNGESAFGWITVVHEHVATVYPHRAGPERLPTRGKRTDQHVPVQT